MDSIAEASTPLQYARREDHSWRPIVRIMSVFVVAEYLLSLTSVAWELERSWSAVQSLFFLHFNVAITIEIVSGVFAAGLVVGGLLTLRGRADGRTCTLVFVPLQLCAGLVRNVYYYFEIFSNGRVAARNTMLMQSVLSLVWMFITPALIWTFFRRSEVRQVLADGG